MRAWPARAYASEALHMDDISLTLLREGYPVKAHVWFSYTAVSGATQGRGLPCQCPEMTDHILKKNAG